MDSLSNMYCIHMGTIAHAARLVEWGKIHKSGEALLNQFAASIAELQASAVQRPITDDPVRGFLFSSTPAPEMNPSEQHYEALQALIPRLEGVLKGMYALQKLTSTRNGALAEELASVCSMYEAEFQVKATILDALTFDLSPSVVQNYITAWSLQCFIDARRVKGVEART